MRVGRARVPQSAASPADSLVYVVRYATHIVGHRVKREAWDAEPSPRALCGVRMTLDIFEKPLVGQCGEVECKRCVSLAAKLV